MADIHLVRTHALGLPAARGIAAQWATQAHNDLGLLCRYETGASADALHFSRSGVSGVLHLDAQRFELHAQLGFLLSGFKTRIEAEIGTHLDALLAASPPVAQPVSTVHPSAVRAAQPTKRKKNRPPAP